MTTTVSVGGGNHVIPTIYGNGTVSGGDGNDKTYITGNGKVTLGNGNDTIAIGRNGTVWAGNGNDQVYVSGDGKVTVGNGNDTVALGEPGHPMGAGSIVAGNGNDLLISYNSRGSVTVGGGHDTLNFFGSANIHQYGAGGADTINLGTGSDTIYEQGQATVWGSYSHGQFGAATIHGGELQVFQDGRYAIDVAVSGHITLQGGAAPAALIGGSGSTDLIGSWQHANDTFIGGSGSDTMTGGNGHNLFAFVSGQAGGSHLITNFVSGQDHLYLDGQSLSYLQSHGDITSSGGNTFISLDGGHTTIELKGVGHLSSSDITTHKP